ncbi:MAG: fatty acyl-AMP ligase, partial [Chloroflexi bacterium]|nr:fatty acyl-AMP ligase [Chloroflexota bacterium]
NHYPQDIESTVERSHPAIRPGCMAAFAVDRRGRERLVVVTEVYSGPRLKAIQLEMDAEITPQSIVLGIRTAIAKEHDIRAHDIVLIQPGTISKTSSGKIQRFACMQDYLSEALKHWGNA